MYKFRKSESPAYLTACRPPDMQHPRSASPRGCLLYSVREFWFAVRGDLSGGVERHPRGPCSGRAALPPRRFCAGCRAGVGQALVGRHETAGRFSPGRPPVIEGCLLPTGGRAMVMRNAAPAVGPSNPGMAGPLLSSLDRRLPLVRHGRGGGLRLSVVCAEPSSWKGRGN